jgi:hypothetical protein
MQYELLANYLEPRFGNIYDGDNGEPWTDELRAAVRRYLLEEMSGEVASEFFLDERKARSEQVDELISTVSSSRHSTTWMLVLVLRPPRFLLSRV